MSEENELLFFETFSHDSAEDLNLDLVQFPRAVLVHEIRVIPLGTRVQADVPGGVRLGATNPSAFKLELFANNLSKRDASTFEKLGLLEYKANVDIQFVPESQTPTDGLIIKGWYTTITLAVYGTLTTVVTREKSPPPPPPPQPRPKVVEPPPQPVLSQTKLSSSLTPSDLPSLPSSKKVHKWLVDSNRPSGSLPATHPSPTSPRQGPQWTPHPTVPEAAVKTEDKMPYPQVLVSPDSTVHHQVAVPVQGPVPNLDQAVLAREIIQVLGVAAQTLEHTKLLSQVPPQQVAPPPGVAGVPPAHEFRVSMATTYQYGECRDTPSSPTVTGYQDNTVTPGYGSRGTVPVVQAAPEEIPQVAPAVEFPQQAQPILATPQPAPMLVEVAPLDWKDHSQEFVGQPLPIPTLSAGNVAGQPPTQLAVTGDANTAPPESEALILEIDPNYSGQAAHSPRDIPLEQSGGSLDPRLDPRELPRDPRDRVPEKKGSAESSREPSTTEPHEPEWKDKGRSVSRSRSRSRDKDYDRRSQRERDYREFRDEHRDYREHRDRSSETQKDWSRDQGRESRDSRGDRTEKSDRDRDRTRDGDRNRDPEWERREDRGRDDRDRNRDQDKSRDKDRNRDQDRDRERTRDSERERDRVRDADRDRERKDSDRDRDRTKKDDDRDRTRDGEQDRERTRDSDRGRDRDKDYGGDKFRSKDPDKDSRDRNRDSVRDRHWEAEQSKDKAPRDKPQVLVVPAVQELRNIEQIPVILSPQNVRSRSPSPESNPEYQEVDMVGLSPEPNIAEVPLQTEIGVEVTEDPVDIYGSLPMDNISEVLSDGEIQEGEPYSDISSDDNILTHFEEVDKISDWNDYEIDDAWNFAISTFNPYQCYLASLETFNDPSLTLYEVQKQKMVLQRSRSEMTPPPEAESIREIVNSYKDCDHHESWVEAMEGIPALLTSGLSYLITETDNKDVLDTLVDWVLEGLDLSQAMKQPETVYIVRHLKMGVRLTAALCSCDSYITFRLLSKEVQHKLLDLLTSQHMSSSVKVQIVRALDGTTRLKDGMDWFLGRHHLQVHAGSGLDKTGLQTKPEPISDKPTAYQRLLLVMLEKQVVRVTVSLAAVARKAHTYEVMLKLKSSVNSLAESTPLPDPKPPGGSTEEQEVAMDTTEAAADQAAMMLDGEVSEEDIEVIVSCLTEVSKVLRNADNLVAHSKRGLPNAIQFTKQEKYDCMGSLFHMLNSCHVLESVFVLLSSPATCNHSGIFNAIKSLLHHLLTALPGLVYLSSRSEDVVNGIIRCLIQSPPSGVEYSQDDEREQHPAHQLGLTVLYHLQALQHVDQLRAYHAKEASVKEVDDAEALGTLHALYTMTFTPQGRDAIVYVLGLEDNMTIFMPFIEIPAEGTKDCRRKSVCYSYTILFLIMMLRYSDQVHWVKKFGTKILLCCENVDVGSSKMAEKLAEIQDTLIPIKKCPNMDSSVTELIVLLKLYNDDIMELPKGIVTVLRMLRHLCSAPDQSRSCQEHVAELKYKYVILELYSADTLPIFCNILQKVGDIVLRPWQQGFPQNSHSRALILSIVRPVLAMMKCILSDLIQAQGSQFKDLSCLSNLLHLHTVLCSWSHTGTLVSSVQQVQDDIVDVIMTYTQPTVDGQDSDQALTKSLWSQVMKEILKYVLLAPYSFLGGLILVSELLPLPLPIQTKEGLSSEEVTTVINNRKLWSAHLHPLSAEIQEILRSLAGSTCHPLQQVLRRVCWQLADLAVPSAVTIVRCLLDVLLENMDQSRERELPQNLEPEANEALLKEEVKSSGETARILSLLSFLMNQAPFKAAFLSLTRTGAKAETKYADTLSRLVKILNIVSETAAHNLAQENVVAILQSLCDCEVTLLTSDNVPLAEQLSSSLPSSDQLSLICTGLMNHVSHPDHRFSSILPSLRTLAMLMDHDYGFYHVKCAMEKVGRAFFNLFMQINITFSKDSSDCLATLSSAAECIQFLVTLPETSQESTEIVPLERTYTMSLAEVRELLAWSSDDFGHPLDEINSLLCEYAKEEETLRAVYESVNAVVTMLKSEEDDSQRQRPDVIEPQMPPPESLVSQFALRSVFTLTDDEDDRLSATYWLATPMMDDQEQEPDMTTSDFEDMIQKYCQDFELKTELDKGSLPSDITATKPRKRRRGNDTINTSRMRGSGSGFVAPMRGRGFGRGMNMNLNKNDPFRSRAPNTSRPPSMHVDDFVKFENQNHSPAQGSNLRLQRQDKDNNVGGRGRGFDRGGGGGAGGRGFFRGGHFPRSGNNQNNSYNRRDQNQRGGFNNFHGGVVGGNRNNQPQRGASVRGSATARGGNTGGHSSPIKGASPWRTARQQGYVSRGFGRGDNRDGSLDRMGSADRLDRRRENIPGSSRFQRGGRSDSGSPWGDKSKERFMPPPGGYRRDRGRHQRAFTK